MPSNEAGHTLRSYLIPDLERNPSVGFITPVSLQFDAPYLAQDGRWYWMARSKDQRQSVLYRSAGAKFPSAGENGLDDLEATSEIFIDVCTYLFLKLSCMTTGPDTICRLML